MAAEPLTEDQRRLLQRWFDGELDEVQGRRAEELVESSAAAASYVEHLEEVRSAVVLASGEVADRGRERLSTEALVASAVEAPPLEKETLEELAPLLERYHDGETTAAEQRSVEQLRGERTDVDDYLESLEFLGDSIRTAEREAAAGADLEALWDGIADEIEPEGEPERDADLLHQYADGELDERRREEVETWLEEDPDARSMLEGIRQVGRATRAAEREAAEGVDLDPIWEGVSERLDFEEGATSPEYDPGRHEYLLHRYADGELEAPRRAEVERWLEEDARARSKLEVIEQLGDATRAAESEARSSADFDHFWQGIDERLEADAPSEDAGTDVVSLDQKRTETTPPAASPDEDGGPDAQSTGVIGWLSEYRQAVGGAAAAAVVLIAAAALFGPNLFEKERVVVKEKKTVVIVDSVEYGSGSTVAVDGPMKQVGSASASKTEPKAEDKPTVIWLLDSNGGDEEAEKPSESGSSSEPADGPAKDDAGPTDETDGGSDGKTPGQPI